MAILLDRIYFLNPASRQPLVASDKIEGNIIPHYPSTKNHLNKDICTFALPD